VEPLGRLVPPVGTAVSVIGHFDDPAAATCMIKDAPGTEPMPPEQVVLSCRTFFVVTDVIELSGY
jgi:hypothetical protein